MKPILSLLLLAAMSVLFNCSTAKANITYKLQKESPLKFHKIEIQKWEVRNQISAPSYASSAQRSAPKRSSGIRMLLIMPSDIKTKIDSVYYGYYKTNIYQGKSKNAYYANFTTNQNDNIRTPFFLENNECVVSYIENGKTKYYKYSYVKDKT